MMLLVLGAVEWGYYFWVSQVVTNAAREGARAGTLHETDNAAAYADATATAQAYLTGAHLKVANAGLKVDLNTLPGGVQSVRVHVEYKTGLTGFALLAVPKQALADAEMRR
jgi:Flp pilus assembly protein TadG